MADNVEIKGLEFVVEGEVEKATKGLDSLADTLGKLKKSFGKGLGLKAVTQELKELDGDTEGAARLTTLANALGAISQASNVEGLSGAFKQLKKISELDFSKLTQAADTIKDIAASAPALTTPGVNVAPMSDTVGGSFVSDDSVEQMDSIAVSAERTTSVLEGLKNAFTKVKGGVSKFGAGLKTLKDSLGKISPTLTALTVKIKGFIKSIGRIAMYRAIRTLLSSITSALRDGINNLYQYSKVLGGTFASSLDGLATNALYLKNSFAAVAAPLINSLMPVLDSIIDKVLGYDSSNQTVPPFQSFVI